MSESTHSPCVQRQTRRQSEGSPTRILKIRLRLEDAHVQAQRRTLSFDLNDNRLRLRGYLIYTSFVN